MNATQCFLITLFRLLFAIGVYEEETCVSRGVCHRGVCHKICGVVLITEKGMCRKKREKRRVSKYKSYDISRPYLNVPFKS